MIKIIDTKTEKKKYENAMFFLVIFYFILISILEYYLQGIFTMLVCLVIFAFNDFLRKI